MAFHGENMIHMWCNYDHDNLTVRDSYNISTVTDIGTGRLKFTFSTNAANDDFCYSGMMGNATGTTGNARHYMNDASPNVAYMRIRYRYVTSTIDDSLVSIICVGEN